MKFALRSVAVLTILLVLAISTYLIMARPVVTGYAAKHMCSGLWVGGLPGQWLKEQAIAPALQPASPWLNYIIDHNRHRVSVSFLWYEQTASWRGYQPLPPEQEQQTRINLGCVLLNEYGTDGLPIGDWQQGRFSGTDITAKTVEKPTNMAKTATDKLKDINKDRLDQLLTQAFQETGEAPRNTLAVLVSHRGRLIAEQYAGPVQPNTPMLGWSMSKSLLPTWIAIQEQIEQREINPKVADNWPWLSAQMTLKQLLRMESGLEFSEWYQPGDDVTTMLYQQGNMPSWVASQTAGATGPRWAYSSGDSNLASFEWTQQLGSDWRSWLVSNVWLPLSITSATVETDRTDTPVTSSYVHMSPRDWLKIGQLWLDGWHNRSPLLPENWMQQATQPSNIHTWGLYGEGFWLNLGSEQRGSKWPSLPKSVFWARGHDGQYVLVAPEQELVVVRFGLTPGSNDGLDTLVAGLIDTLDQTH